MPEPVTGACRSTRRHESRHWTRRATQASRQPQQQHGGDAVAHVVCTGDESAVSDVQRFDGVYARILTAFKTPVAAHTPSSTRCESHLCLLLGLETH